MHDEENVTLARELLTSMILGLLSAMDMTRKSDEIKVQIMFSPQVFNPENKNKPRKLTFVITACIRPIFGSKSND